MNKAHLMVAAFSLVIGTTMLLPGLNIVFAQYTGGGQTGGVTLEEQLKLAKAKITNAQQAGAYGSGTSMFGANFGIDQTVLYIIIIAVIIGGVSAAFFAAGGSGKKRYAETTVEGGYAATGKFCTNCGVQLGDSQKFCGNCGAKA